MKKMVLILKNFYPEVIILFVERFNRSNNVKKILEKEDFESNDNASLAEDTQPKFQVSLFGELQEHEDNSVNVTAANSSGLPGNFPIFLVGNP